MSRTVPLLALVVVLAALAVGHGSGPAGAIQAATPASARPITVPVDVHDMAVIPTQSVFRVGQAYRFVVTNSGKATHELVIEQEGAVNAALHADGKAAEAEGIAPGQSKEMLWTFDKPGAFQVACHQPGHYEAGMVRRIEVTNKAVVIPVTVGDMFIKMAPADLKPNTLYAFVITNGGRATHEVVAEQAGAVDKALAGTNEPESSAEAENVAPGSVRELVWDFAAAGNYQLACHKPGHFEAGMVQPFSVN